MRRLVDVVAAGAALAFAAGLAWTQFERLNESRVVSQAADEVRRFDLEIKLRAASEGVTLTGRGWPETVDPSWFEASPPRNPLLSVNRPWVEVASLDQAHLLNPPVRIATTESLASFWYNPYQGVIRARVPFTINDDEAVELYNRLNHTELASIFATWDELRPPPSPLPQTEVAAESTPEADRIEVSAADR